MGEANWTENLGFKEKWQNRIQTLHHAGEEWVAAVQQKTAHVKSLASPSPSGTVPSGFRSPQASSGSSAESPSLPGSSLRSHPLTSPPQASPCSQISAVAAGADKDEPRPSSRPPPTADSWASAVADKTAAAGSYTPPGLDPGVEPDHPVGPFHDFPHSPLHSTGGELSGPQDLIPLGTATNPEPWVHRSPTKLMGAGPSSWASPARSDASAISIGPRGSPLRMPLDQHADCSSNDEPESGSPTASSAGDDSPASSAHSAAVPSRAASPQDESSPSTDGGGSRAQQPGGVASPAHSAESLPQAFSGLSGAASVSPRAVHRPRTAQALLSRLALPGDGVGGGVGGQAWPSPSASGSEASWSIAVPSPQPIAADSPVYGHPIGSPPAGTSTAEWAGFRALAASASAAGSPATRNSVALSLDGPGGLRRGPAETEGSSLATSGPADDAAVGHVEPTLPTTPMNHPWETAGSNRMDADSPACTQSFDVFGTPMGGAPTPAISWKGQSSSMASGSLAGYSTPMGALEPPTPCSATPVPTPAAQARTPILTSLSASHEELATAMLWCHETIDDDTPQRPPMPILGPPPVYPRILSPAPCSPPAAAPKPHELARERVPEGAGPVTAAATSLAQPGTAASQEAPAADAPSASDDAVSAQTPEVGVGSSAELPSQELGEVSGADAAPASPAGKEWGDLGAALQVPCDEQSMDVIAQEAGPEAASEQQELGDACSHGTQQQEGGSGPTDGSCSDLQEQQLSDDGHQAASPLEQLERQNERVIKPADGSKFAPGPSEDIQAAAEDCMPAPTGAHTEDQLAGNTVCRASEQEGTGDLDEASIPQQDDGQQEACPQEELPPFTTSEDATTNGVSDVSPPAVPSPRERDGVVQQQPEANAPALAAAQAAGPDRQTAIGQPTVGLLHDTHKAGLLSPRREGSAGLEQQPRSVLANPVVLQGMGDNQPPSLGADGGGPTQDGAALSIPSSAEGHVTGSGGLPLLDLPSPGVLQAITNTHSPSPGAGGAVNPWDAAQSPSQSGGGHSGAATGSWWSSSSASNSFRGGPSYSEPANQPQPPLMCSFFQLFMVLMIPFCHCALCFPCVVYQVNQWLLHAAHLLPPGDEE